MSLLFQSETPSSLSIYIIHHMHTLHSFVSFQSISAPPLSLHSILSELFGQKRKMGHLLPLLFLLIVQYTNAQPSPGYYPSTKIRQMQFYQGYNTLWGPQHQSLSQDQSSLTIWLDKNSGTITFLTFLLYFSNFS